MWGSRNPAAIRADQVAYFDGRAWHAFGSTGTNGPWSGNGLALATYNHSLFAGGNFTSVGGDSLAEGIASSRLSSK